MTFKIEYSICENAGETVNECYVESINGKKAISKLILFLLEKNMVGHGCLFIKYVYDDVLQGICETTIKLLSISQKKD